MIDYLNVAAAMARPVPREAREIGGVRYQLTRWSNATHFFKRIQFDRGAGCEPLEFQERVAKFGVGDFQGDLGHHGMRIEEVFGDYRLASYDAATSPRMIMIARAAQRSALRRAA
jgi:hypothetical protein